MASRAELEAELEVLDRREFYIQMIDHWTTDDAAALDRIWARQREIKRILDELR